MTAQDRNEEYSTTTATWTTRPEKRNRIAGIHELPRRESTRWQQAISNIATAIQLGWHALLCSGATNPATPLHIIIILLSHFVWIIFSIFREDHKRCLNRTREESRGVSGCLHLFRPGWLDPYNGPRSAYLIIHTIQLVFLVGTIFFFHNNSVRTVFSVNSVKFQQAEWDRSEKKKVCLVICWLRSLRWKIKPKYCSG